MILVCLIFLVVMVTNIPVSDCKVSFLRKEITWAVNSAFSLSSNRKNITPITSFFPVKINSPKSLSPVIIILEGLIESAAISISAAPLNDSLI